MKRIIGMLLFPAVLFSVSSCINEDVPGENPAEGGAQMTLELKFPGEFQTASTRTLDFTSENTIDNVYVLVFNQTNNLVDIKPADNLAPAPGPDPNYAPGQPYSATYNFNVTLPPSTGANTTRLVVLANSAAILANTIGTNTSSGYIGRSYDDVIAAIYDNLNGQMYPNTTGRIPMWGETPQIQVSPATSNQTVDMVRAVARVDVGVGQPSWNASSKSYTWNGNNAQGTAIPFRITSVTVLHPNNRYTVVPAQANHTGTSVSAPTIASGTTAYSTADSKTNFTYNTTTGYVTYSIYVPEADVFMGVGGTPGDANHTTRMAIVVGGNYNNSSTTTYYRLEFANNNNLMDVLRNHLYQFNIQAATGPGSATVDDAYASQSVNMTANVLQWNLNNMGNIVFDGTNTLAVTPRDTMRLFSNQYTAISPTRDNAMTVRTDVPAGWRVDHIAAANADGTDGALNPNWIQLNPTSGAANTTADVTVSVTQNTTGANRTANVWFAAGRLRYRVRVVQGTQPALDLRIRNSANTQDINELVFAAPGGTAPAAQSFVVSWLPATNPVTVAASTIARYEFPNPGGNPAVNDGAPFQGESRQPGNGTTTYTVAPPALTAAEVANDPFITKSSRFDFSVNNGFATMTRSITLRQMSYALLVEPNPLPLFPMDGARYGYNVRSNTTWRISNIVETPRVSGTRLIAAPTGIDNVYTNAAGGPNTTPGGGWRESLTTNNANRGGSGYADVTYSSDQNPAQFQPVTRRLFFPSAPFNIFSICLMNSNSPDARTYSYWSGSGPNQPPMTDHDVQTMTNGTNNYGILTSGSGTSDTFTSTVPVRSIGTYGLWVGGSSSASTNGSSYSGTTVTTAMINAAVAANADMLVISGDSKIPFNGGTTTAEAGAIYDNFLAKDKPVLLFTDDNNSVLALFIAIRNGGRITGNMSASNGQNGNAAVYRFANISDPILEGPFRDSRITGSGVTQNTPNTLQGVCWGVDGAGTTIFSFTDGADAGVITYANANDQSNTTTTASPNTTYPMFRFRNVPLVVVGDGGFLASSDQGNTTSSPTVVNTSTKAPDRKNSYGGNSSNARLTYNAMFVANTVAWAIQRRTTQ